MRRTRLFCALGVLGIAGSLALSAPAAAYVTPTNDAWSGAIEVSGLPFDDTAYSYIATTDDDVVTFSAFEGASINQSVWYKFTAPADVSAIVVDAVSTEFSPGIIIGRLDGDGTSWSFSGSGDEEAMTGVTADTTYGILVYNRYADTSGGAVQVHVDSYTEPPSVTPPTLELSLNTKAKLDKRGNIIASGTYMCTGEPGTFGGLGVSAFQPVGRLSTVSGDGQASIAVCDGTVQTWSAVIYPYNGKFGGSRATINASASVFDPYGNEVDAYVPNTSVKLATK